MSLTINPVSNFLGLTVFKTCGKSVTVEYTARKSKRLSKKCSRTITESLNGSFIVDVGVPTSVTVDTVKTFLIETTAKLVHRIETGHSTGNVSDSVLKRSAAGFESAAKGTPNWYDLFQNMSYEGSGSGDKKPRVHISAWFEDGDSTNGVSFYLPYNETSFAFFQSLSKDTGSKLMVLNGKDDSRDVTAWTFTEFMQRTNPVAYRDMQIKASKIAAAKAALGNEQDEEEQAA